MHCRVWLQSERGCLHAFGLTRAFLWGEACRERLSQMSERPDVFSQRTSMNQNGHERPSYTVHLNNAICTTVHISSSGCLCTSCKFKLQILKSHKLITPALVDLSCCDGLQADSKQLRSTSNLHWWLYPEKKTMYDTVWSISGPIYYCPYYATGCYVFWWAPTMFFVIKDLPAQDMHATGLDLRII